MLSERCGTLIIGTIGENAATLSVPDTLLLTANPIVKDPLIAKVELPTSAQVIASADS
jgi:hypothetical protein